MVKMAGPHLDLEQILGQNSGTHLEWRDGTACPDALLEAKFYF